MIATYKIDNDTVGSHPFLFFLLGKRLARKGKIVPKLGRTYKPSPLKNKPESES